MTTQFAEIPKELLDELIARKYLARNHLPEFGRVPDCGKCEHKSGVFDSALLLHVWGAHEIKPTKLREKVRAWLFEQHLIGVTGSFVDEKDRRLI